jgi:uncharacterized membrane protein YbjE (DUF340 family)
MMKGAIITGLSFVGGIAVGKTSGVPVWISPVALCCLYAFMFLVGVGMGLNDKIWEGLRTMTWRVVAVPVSVGAGSVAGAAAASLILPQLRIQEAMAVGAGCGYYSLSSLIISRMGDPVLGSVALLSNLSRELFTIAAASWMVRHVGQLAPIASGGATSMDVTLPTVIKFSGEQYALISLISGVVLTLLVPVLVPLFMRL